MSAGAPSSGSPGTASLSVAAKYYYLFLFTCSFMILTIDRSIVSVMLEPIKAEFGLSDTHLGFMNGIAFAICFGVAGIPFGRLADRVDRRKVLVPCLVFFSLMTLFSGLARNFLQLVTARFLVGAGEAGGQPAMLSMMTDMYPGKRRASAVGIYYLAQPLGALIIYLWASRVVAEVGWRQAFFIAGVPGLVLGVLVWFTVREPVRGASEAFAGKVGDAPTIREARAFIASQRSLLHLLATGALMSVGTAGVGAWIVSFLIRSHDLPLANAGAMMAASYCLPTAGGILLGGAAVDYLGHRTPAWRTVLPGIALILTLPAGIGLLATPSLLVCGILIGIWSFLVALPYASVVSLTQSLAPPRLRGLVTGTYYASTYIIGVGLGPQGVGIVSDLLGPAFGKSSLAIAMAIIGVPTAWAGIHAILASKTLGNDLARISGEGGVPAARPSRTFRMQEQVDGSA